MSTEQYIWQTAEAAVTGQLDPEAARELESRLHADPVFAQSYQDCLNLLRNLKENGEQQQFRSQLKEIHQKLTQTPKKQRFSFQPQYWRTASIAAGIAVLTSLTSVWMLQHSEPKTNSSQRVRLLEREINHIKVQQNQQQQQIEHIKGQQAHADTRLPSNFSGTGFALTNDGYIVTNYHVTEGADSIYIQTRNGSYHKAVVFAFDEKADVALLRVEDKDFRFSKGDLPYTFAPSKASLGARIYTLGFPQDEIVYNEGYISSRNGYEGDSMQYRLEIAASPGQSGAPVLDELGNILAVIKSKDLQVQGTTYAVSTKALLHLVRDLPPASSIHLPKVNRLASMSREQQIEKLQDYTCMVQVYK